jgi:NAD(P)-dependent dehydrogenase (short-subunit alcohol dehydrogenase family)/acyl carrier protein
VITTLHRDRSDVDAVGTALAQLHNHGHSPLWRALYPDARIVALPTYAFQHRSYWVAPVGAAEVSGPVEGALWKAVDEGAVDAVAQVLGISDADNGASLGAVVHALRQWRSDVGVRSAVNKLRYRVGWQVVTPNAFPLTRRRWLVLVFPEQSDDVWIAGLLARYAEAIEVLTVDPCGLDRNSLSAFLVTAAARSYCDGIVSFLATDERAHRDFSGISVGLFSTLLVVQAHCDAGLGMPLWVITQGGVCVSADDGPASPSQSAVWGLGQSVCLEHPDQWGGLIDLPRSATPQDIEHLYAILTCPQLEDQLAIRRCGVSGRRLLEAPLPLERLERVCSWKPSGTALVTGAPGRLGKHVVRWLAEAGANPVVLVSCNAAEHRQSAELEKELHTCGVVAVSVSVDVADRSALAGVLAGVRRVHGSIRTVVHAAEIVGLNAITDTTVEEFCHGYAARAVGATNLVELFEDEPPDTFILFSSPAGTWGGARQGCYAAASAHIDALAVRLRSNGHTALSAAFGLWADENGSLSHEILNFFQRIGINQIPPKAALAALQQAIEANDTLITIADVSWDRFLPAFTARRSHPLLSELASRVNTSETSSASAASAEGLQARLAAQTAEQQLHTLTMLVANTTATVLAHPDPGALDTDLTFQDLSIDSLTALELRNALTRSTGLTLPATLVFDHPTPTALAKHLTGLLTNTPALGPIGQLLDGALNNGEHTTLIDVLIATSNLDSAGLGQGEPPNQLTVTDLTAGDDAPARLVCLSEFHGQYQTFATGIQENIQVTEVIAPGFSRTLLPPTAERAAQTIIDALEERISGSQTLVVAGHGVTCTLALHVFNQLSQKAGSTGAKLPQLAMVFIAPITARNVCAMGADPLLFQAISTHLHSEGDLIAYGRYLRFGMQLETAGEERLLNIHPRTDNHITTPVSPLVLEPALTALTVSSWVDELQ